MIILVGKSGSGKDAIAKELVSRGYKKVVTVTTRPPRTGEVNGKSYHFVNDKTFRECIDNEIFAEYRVYHTNVGDWFYGSLIKDYESESDKKVIILTPDGYNAIVKKTLGKFHSIYIKADYDTLKEHLEKRGDDSAEIIRRMKEDSIDFYGIEDNVHHIIENNGNKTIAAVVDEILEKIGGEAN